MESGYRVMWAGQTGFVSGGDAAAELIAGTVAAGGGSDGNEPQPTPPFPTRLVLL